MKRIREARNVFWFLLGFVIVLWAGLAHSEDIYTYTAEIISSTYAEPPAPSNKKIDFSFDKCTGIRTLTYEYDSVNTRKTIVVRIFIFKNGAHSSSYDLSYLATQVNITLTGTCNVCPSGFNFNSSTNECEKDCSNTQSSWNFYPSSNRMDLQGKTDCSDNCGYTMHCEYVPAALGWDDSWGYTMCQKVPTKQQCEEGDNIDPGDDTPPPRPNCEDKTEQCNNSCGGADKVQTYPVCTKDDASSYPVYTPCECKPNEPCEDKSALCAASCGGADKVKKNPTCDNSSGTALYTACECKDQEPPPETCEQAEAACKATCGEGYAANFSCHPGPPLSSICKCEKDQDKDGTPNTKDNDVDNDGIPNGQDDDIDNDGVKNGDDVDPYGSNEGKIETGSGTGDGDGDGEDDGSGTGEEPNTGDFSNPYSPGEEFNIADRFNMFIGKVKQSSLFSFSSNFFNSIPGGGNPNYTIDAGSYGTYTIDLSENIGSGLAILKTILMIVFSFISIRVIILKQ